PVYGAVFYKICPGDTFRTRNNIYTYPVTFRDTVPSAAGCDSIITTDISWWPVSFFTQSKQICAGDSVKVVMRYYKITGVYKDTLKNSYGCDSVITTNLTVTPPPRFQQHIEICSGESFSVGSHHYSVTGNYTDQFKTTL